MDKHPAKIEILDIQMGISVGLCFLIATLLANAGVTKVVGSGESRRTLEIFQTITSCIACMLCSKDNMKVSFKAGINRLIITAVGGIVGILVVLIDNKVNNWTLMTVLMILGIVFTLLLCKCCKVPYINARIGGVTFILVACTMQGNGRIWYALFRFLSTFGGILITLLVTWVFSMFAKKEKNQSLI